MPRPTERARIAARRFRIVMRSPPCRPYGVDLSDIFRARQWRSPVNPLLRAERPFAPTIPQAKETPIGTSTGKPANAMAQQHLRNVLAYLDMPALGQPEAFVQWTDDLLSSDGEAGEASRDFLDGWMKAFLGLVEIHA